jgi:hypothetical protein
MKDGLIGYRESPKAESVESVLRKIHLAGVGVRETILMYDSTTDTLIHIRRVQALLGRMARNLLERGEVHDASKLGPEEKPLFDEMTPLLKSLTYGSDEYKASLEKLGVALKHHYAVNSHHPEHFSNGVSGMNILDVLEMLCDWKAASERTSNGDIHKSVEIGITQFSISPQLADILRNSISLVQG